MRLKKRQIMNKKTEHFDLALSYIKKHHLKGTVSRDFLNLFFNILSEPLMNRFSNFFVFAKIFAGNVRNLCDSADREC